MRARVSSRRLLKEMAKPDWRGWGEHTLRPEYGVVMSR